MCMMNGKQVSEYNSPCGNCPEFLNSCMPIVVEGFLFGECDTSYCEYCSCYDECMFSPNAIEEKGVVVL